jgi:hypothetical protein
LAPVFFEARKQAAPIARLELEWTRYHLRALFHALHLAGLPDLALRALQLADDCDLAKIAVLGKRFKALKRSLKCRGFFALHLPKRGALSKEQAQTLGGYAARAAGIDDDTRAEDESYRRLGFSLIAQQESNTQTRWRQRLAEIAQSLTLADRAQQDNVVTANLEALETPRGPWRDELPKDASALLEDLLPGLEWGEALATIASLYLAAASQWPREAQEKRGEGAA